MQVMVVDDEPLVRLSLKRGLERRGHTVFEAADGQIALDHWTVFKPQLVFLDVLMPRLSGPDLLKRLSTIERNATKIVLMSAFVGEYDLTRAKALGADLFLGKPFEDVFAVIQQGEDLCGERRKEK